jgi:hypothetical protein
MSAENGTNTPSPAESDRRKYPFGLSSVQFAVLVVLGGLIGPGLLVYAFEQANRSAVADLVWIVGYGTTIVVVWFFWLRPVDLGSSAGQDTSLTEESEQSDRAPEERNGETESPDHTNSSLDSTLETEDRAQQATQEPPVSSDSK